MAARTRYAPDRGLTVRMTATMFLLGLVFVAFVAAIIGIGTAYHASSAAIVLFAVVLGGGFAIGSLFYSDKIALRTAGAVEVTPQQAPELHGIVDRLCALADMPKPRVAIANTDMPNAFATGRNSEHAVLCVTTGLMRRLEPAELEGVIAHEMSHVAHKDVQVMTAASFLAIIAALLIRIAFYGELFGGGRGRGGNNQNTAIIMFALMAVSIIVYAVSFLLIRMLSRYRELSADRSGALLTGQPSALKSALIKVTGDMSRIPTKDLRTAQPHERVLLRARYAPGTQGEPGQRLLHPPEPRAQAGRARQGAAAAQPDRRVRTLVGFLDTLLGRTKPVQPKLDDLFALPSAAVTLDAGAGFKPTGSGSVCFRPVEGRSFSDVQKDVQELLDMSSGKEGGLPVEVTKDSYGFTWLVSSRMSDELDALVTDLHAVNSSLVDAGFGPQLLCTLVAFSDDQERRLALVYLFKRGTFYPFAPLSGERRDNALELQVKGVIGSDLKFEPDLARWFPVWGAPGL